MTGAPDSLPPELEAELKAHWDQQEDAREQAKSLTWTSFLDWLKGQSDLLKRNPGLIEQITSLGPALLTHIIRLFA